MPPEYKKWLIRLRLQTGAGNNERKPGPFYKKTMADYTYIGSKITDEAYKGKPCNAVRRRDGKCIRGKNGSMLVEFDGVRVNVIGRLLRRIK
jgi:hypothetical protein